MSFVERFVSRGSSAETVVPENQEMVDFELHRRRFVVAEIMTNDSAPATFSRAPGEMKVLNAFGDRMTLHLTGEDTGGKFCMFTLDTPPGGGPPPHLHEREDEWFLVLEGRAEFLKNGVWVEVPAGGTVFAPKGTIHSFRNVGETMLRQVIHTAPAGFERFFAAIAEELQKEGDPDMGRIVKLSGEFGIRFPEMEPGSD